MQRGLIDGKGVGPTSVCCGRAQERRWEYPFFTVPFSPSFRRSKTFPTIPFVKISSPHSPTEKWGALPLTDTHRHGGWCGCLLMGVQVVQNGPITDDCGSRTPGAYRVRHNLCSTWDCRE